MQFVTAVATAKLITVEMIPVERVLLPVTYVSTAEPAKLDA
jgi:hypothetical protein